MPDDYEAPSVARRLHLDLRGKTKEEVLKILREHGYRVSLRQETEYGKPNIINLDPTSEDKEDVIWCIHLNWRDAHNLSIITERGDEHVLRGGQNPCFWEPVPGKRPGGWGWLNTDYIGK